MNDDRLRDRLLEQEGGLPARHGDEWMKLVVARAHAFERQVRIAALVSWGVTLATLPLCGFLVFWIRTGGGTSLEVARAAAMVLFVLGGLGLLAAVLTTIAWLFRSRAPTLAAIEQRLAALEDLLAESRHV